MNSDKPNLSAEKPKIELDAASGANKATAKETSVSNEPHLPLSTPVPDSSALKAPESTAVKPSGVPALKAPESTAVKPSGVPALKAPESTAVKPSGVPALKAPESTAVKPSGVPALKVPESPAVKPSASSAPNLQTSSDSAAKAPESTGKQPKHRVWANARLASIGVFVLSILAVASGFLPGWVAGLGALPVLATSLGLKRGLLGAALAAALIVPAWQPDWVVFIAPVTAIACGIAGWRWKKGAAWRVIGFLGAIIGYVVALAALTQLVVPYLQPAAYWAFGFLPSLIMPALAIVLASYGSWRLFPRIAGSIFKFAAIASVLAVCWGTVAAACWLNFHPSGIELQMRWSMSPEMMLKLPETNNDRILPRATGEYYVKDSNNQTGYSTEAPHIILEEGNLWWQSPLHNDRWYGRIFGSVPAVVRVDADKIEKRKEDTGNSGFIFGNESWVLSSAFKARHFLAEPGSPSYYHRTSNNTWVMLVPCISKRPFWTGLMLPYVAGVMAVEQDGMIHDYSIGAAEKLFPGAVFFPPELGADYAHAYGKWRGGFWKTVIGQSGIMEVSENRTNDPGFNPQPYIINFKELGLQEVIAFEPLGEHQYAMIEVLFFDAASGRLRSYSVPDNVSLSGPRRCLEQVRSSDTQTDWSHRRTVEPRLVVSDKGVFFLVTITAKEPQNPQDQPYITSVLINASTLHSQRFQQPDALRQFLSQPAGK